MERAAADAGYGDGRTGWCCPTSCSTKWLKAESSFKKMVITPHNESWPFGRLIEEVSREHALFMEMERLKKLTDRAHRRLEQQEEQALREAARQAKDLLARMRLQDDRQPTHEQLSGAADCLQQLLDKM